MRAVIVCAAALGLVLAAAAGSGATTATAVICTGVNDRTPIGVAGSFPASVGTLYCFSDVRGGSGKVVHVWIYGEREMARIELPVRGERWRTWSQKRIQPAWKGSWRVEVRAEDGTLLASPSFVVE